MAVVVFVGGYVVVNAHAGGAGGVPYTPALKTPANFAVNSVNCYSTTGVTVSWDQPRDFAKIDYYVLYRNGVNVGSFGTAGAKLPKRITTFFQLPAQPKGQCTYAQDSFTVQSFADSAHSNAAHFTSQ